mgnify:CR=1 FL=1
MSWPRQGKLENVWEVGNERSDPFQNIGHIFLKMFNDTRRICMHAYN